MPGRLQLKDALPIVAPALSLCQTDQRAVAYINRSCERLLYPMKAVGTVVDYEVCISSGCITLPREIETVEAYSLCGTPGTVRNGWYVTLPHGPGSSNSKCFPGNQLIDKGDVCSFDNVIGTGKKLAVYCDKQEEAGKTITLQFWDGNAQWVRGSFNGLIVDGEKIALPAAGTYAYSANTCKQNGLVRVFKDLTAGTVRLYEYDPSTLLLRPLGYYQPDETTPVYRRSEIRNLSCSTDTPCSLFVKAKVRFIPVYDDEDVLCISYAGAILLAAQGLLKQDNGKLIEGEAYIAAGKKLLDEQLHHWQGDGAVAPISFETNRLPAVQNLI